mmetsp:Transcript_19354/g.38676  ORF Transcript_19354/g.38676 Transcript_19354/m.38676 type:complete len:102 (+) Transcript_19354:27-332(+)|eukprot:CAMPEP_0182464298 /NCGR_PEP_ID=MMETSP1319-20130603/8494_1 /TAXON_ID=172717 /ORGANISM="Bolidomonas pacifica, Strain RCC208" /LENGTH=101 /DNA_ID=CAMNT_0024663937 /DNA_START=17 /DNA_END=322 /DNA_ORIENTATION=+
MAEEAAPAQEVQAEGAAEQSLDEQFAAAAEFVKTLSPSDEEKLRLYGLFKQANSGDVEGSRPGMFSMVARAKWDAWKANEGMDSEAAKLAYVEVARELGME